MYAFNVLLKPQLIIVFSKLKKLDQLSKPLILNDYSGIMEAHQTDMTILRSLF